MKCISLISNATLSYTIPHLALPEDFSSADSINGSEIPNLYKYSIFGQVSPDTYGYSDLIQSTDSVCDSPIGFLEPPCGTPALSDGLIVHCSWMAGGGDKICDDAMKTMEFVK